MDISTAFDRTLNRFGISGKWLAEQSGVSEVVISRFRNGRQVQTDTLGKLLVALPFEVQQYFFESLLGAGIKARSQTLEEIIEDMDSRSLTCVLQAIAGNLSLRLNGSALEREAS